MATPAPLQSVPAPLSSLAANSAATSSLRITGYGMALPPPRPRHIFPCFGDCFSFGFDHFFFFHRRHFLFFGGSPFLTPGCFFDGFSNVCIFQPFFFSPFGFAPFGFPFSGVSLIENPAPAPPAPPTERAPEFGPFTTENPPAPPTAEETPPETLTILVFKDGSSYAAVDYWLANGRLWYVTSYGGENSIAIEQLDLERTVDENAARGVPLTLRPAPAQQE